MPTDWLLILLAVVLGWIVQLFATYYQSTAFNASAFGLRRSGTVSIGAGGKRYRGGRAFVAIAADDDGVVRDAIRLSGFTTFARAKAAPQLVGLRVNKIRGERDIDGLTKAQRTAARQAAELWRRPKNTETRATQEVLG
jgi:glucitol operon activator protein